jgi:lipopolysaccharide transport system ATP-binding protein
MNTVIQVKGLWKQYRLGVYGHGMLFKDLQSWWARFRGREDPNAPLGRELNPQVEESDLIWALRDLSLDVQEGEVLGIVGRNGAGKSTLLKIMSRVTAPTRGEIRIKGRIASLLEVGTGFHPELTGRENVYLNGAILGMRIRETKRKFDEIVQFAGVERFIDTPVKRYSSGMHVRLAFAVAAHLDPEILLVDEVLAVGDAAFQQKCLAKMDEITGQGRTILFVSHNTSAIRNLCKRAVLIENGRIKMDGKVDGVLEHYLEDKTFYGAVASGDGLNERMITWYPQGEVFFSCSQIAVVDENDTPRRKFVSREPITIAVTLECHKQVPKLEVIVEIADRDNNVLLRSEYGDDPESSRYHSFPPGVFRLNCVIPPDFLGEKTFYVSVHLIAEYVEHVVARQIVQFEVEFLGYENNHAVYSKDAYFRPRLAWSNDRLE